MHARLGPLRVRRGAQLGRVRVIITHLSNKRDNASNVVTHALDSRTRCVMGILTHARRCDPQVARWRNGAWPACVRMPSSPWRMPKI